MSTDLPDTNIWLALALSHHAHHALAREWFDAVGGELSVLFCRSTQHSLLRLLTTAAVLAPYGTPPLGNDAAWRVYQAFLADDRVALRTDEPAELEAQWVRLAARATASPKLWMDAHLAAFALTGGHRLVTLDTAFRQFDGVDLLVVTDPGERRST